MQIILPVYESFVDLHDLVLEISGGKKGIRDNNVILDAVDRPKTYLAYHPNCDLHTVCAVLLDSIARNHAFIEGNKRAGLMVAIYTYKMNGCNLDFSLFMNSEFTDLALQVVLEKPDVLTIAKRFHELSDKYRVAGIDRFATAMKRWVKPYNYD